VEKRDPETRAPESRDEGKKGGAGISSWKEGQIHDPGISPGEARAISMDISSG